MTGACLIEEDNHRSPIASKDAALRDVAIARRKILALVEGVFGNSSQWPFIRTQLLTILGERGLQGAIDKAFEGIGNDGDRNHQNSGR